MEEIPTPSSSPSPTKPHFHGSCTCGRITYTTTTTPYAMTYCHCSTCRQHSGRSYLTFGHFHNDAVTFKASATPTTAASRGEPEIKQTHSGMATRGSCGSCGAPLFMKYHCKPDGVDIVLSTVDEGDMRRIKPGLEKEHIFVEQDPGASEEDPGDGVERHVGFDGGFQRRLDDWQKRGSPRRPDV